ncbi:MAG: hypothetical protein Q6361_02560 [Candidatus Hermodarchaeota archaeon]|nr:hypothetical protein [Candidatus Hermodarchaeota archaeon]
MPRFTFSGTIRIEITEVTEKTYTVYITHDMAVDGELRVVRPETRTYYFDEPMIFNFRKGTRYAGDETINTALGTKEVARYVYEDGRVRQDIYVDKDSNLLLAEYEKSTSAADTDAYLRISQTNIGWLEAP